MIRKFTERLSLGIECSGGYFPQFRFRQSQYSSLVAEAMSFEGSRR